MKINKTLLLLSLLCFNISSCKENPISKTQKGTEGEQSNTIDPFDPVAFEESSSVTQDSFGGLAVIKANVAFNTATEHINYYICSGTTCNPTSSDPKKIYRENSEDTNKILPLVSNNACNSSTSGVEIECTVYFKPCKSDGCATTWINKNICFFIF